MGFHGGRATRERDEVVLDWLAQKCAGLTWKQIGARCGVNWQAVQNACMNVRRADREKSGEPTATVERGYWS